jgi:integrase
MRICKHTGEPLPPNLYNDNRGRVDRYRYRTPAGNYTALKNTYREAVALAARANAARDTIPGNRYALPFWSREYIEFTERQTPGLEFKKSWVNRKNQLRTFAEAFAQIRTDRLDISTLSHWWDSLTYDQQHNRRSNLSKFFLYMMGKDVAKSNPFTSSEDVAHLSERGKPSKSRLPLHEADFWKVYDHAPQFLRDAMVVSFATTLRRSDVVNIRFDHIVDGALRVTVGKSVGQRGFARASHLSWSLDKHEALRELVNESRERSLSLKRCPYLIAFQPAKNRARQGNAHPYKVRADKISKAFGKARDASGVWDNIAPGRMPPSFHEIRGLAIERLLAGGADLREVQKLAAHTDESITSGYAANHDPEYASVELAAEIKKPA